MIVSNNINNPYRKFKTQSHPLYSPKKKKEINFPALVGSVAGVGIGMIATRKIPTKNPTVIQDLTKLIAMAAGGIVGGIAGGSVGATKEDTMDKIHEGAFQILNVVVPLFCVGGTTSLCRKTPQLNNNACKIIGSFGAMVVGAFGATGITNLIRGKKEEKRKYTYKDTFTNFDDIVATVNIGFKEWAEKIPVAQILPFIYAYNGYRAGKKE